MIILFKLMIELIDMKKANDSNYDNNIDNTEHNNINNNDKNENNDNEESKNPPDKVENFNNISMIDRDGIVVKYFQYYKKNLKSIMRKGFIFISFFLIYLFYFFSLEGCYEGEGHCTRHVDWITFKIKEEIISIVINFIMFQLMIFKKISKLHLVHYVIIFGIFYSYSHGMQFEDHGYFNFIFYFIILGIISFIIFPFELIIIFFKGKKRLAILLIFVSVSLITVYLYSIIGTSCSDWTKGLNNTNIDFNNTKYGCQIQIPKNCVYKILGIIQDYTKIGGKTTNRIGYPLTNKALKCALNYFKCVYHNLVDMDNKEILNKYFKDEIPEVYIDFNKEGIGKLIIDIKFNKTLSNERKVLEKKSNPYSSNILILYIDSLSRANAIRQLNKTMSFFEQFMSYKGGFNEKYPSEIYHSFQFFKYQSFVGHTSTNYPFLFMGQKKNNKNKIYRTKNLKKKGYITSNAHDYCDIENTNLKHTFTMEELYDHQFIICDKSNESINLNTIRCFYDKQNIEQLYDYTEQFWRKYSNNRKYSLISTNHGHEGTLAVIKYVDDIIINFLNRLFNDGLLKETSIILLSDHGVGMPSIYYLYDFYKIEINLPVFFIIINDRKNITYEEQYKYMNENQQTFITAFDIYNTIENLIYGDEYLFISNKTLEKDTSKSKNGISLFNKINGKERHPKKIYNYSKLNLGICI